jgi:hypothetical protein
LLKRQNIFSGGHERYKEERQEKKKTKETNGIERQKKAQRQTQHTLGTHIRRGKDGQGRNKTVCAGRKPATVHGGGSNTCKKRNKKKRTQKARKEREEKQRSERKPKKCKGRNRRG